MLTKGGIAYIVGIPMRERSLGEFEQLVLLAILRQGDAAYAVPIRREIQKRTRRSVSRGALYITLDRLEDKGLLESWLADASAERGGRPRRYYKVRPLGLTALKASRAALQSMWEGLEPRAREV